MTHCFNRAYTVASPATFDAFRAPAGLAMVRHYALNENMMFDKTTRRRSATSWWTWNGRDPTACSPRRRRRILATRPYRLPGRQQLRSRIS